MIVKVLRYQVRREGIEAALAATRAFVDEVARKEGGTAKYEAFQSKDDPTRFTHLMSFRTPSAEDYHKKTAWNKAFLEKLAPLCAQAPVAEEVVKVE